MHSNVHGFLIKCQKRLKSLKIVAKKGSSRQKNE